MSALKSAAKLNSFKSILSRHVEKSRSWSSAHDWKSCNRQKRFEGSNPSFSAKEKSTRKGAFFFGFQIKWKGL